MRSASFLSLTGIISTALAAIPSYCPDYFNYSKEYHAPFSGGAYNLSYQRPSPDCRTVNSSAVEDAISDMMTRIQDPDLRRLFVNSFPNTLDTAIKWTGHAANNSAEELTFVITGDINAMWLRDSCNQMLSYLSFLQNSSTPVFASLYRGVINLQARYIQIQPYCNSFQPPPESGINASVNSYALTDQVHPPFNNLTVFECKYELDSIAAFLELSAAYYEATNDLTFFSSFQWVPAVQTVLNTANAMMTPTYASNGMVNQSPYTFQRFTTSATETLDNKGIGNPVFPGTGLVRSAFRPSDDACIYQLFIPANMIFSTFLNRTAPIMAALGQSALASEMSDMSNSIRAAITAYGVVTDAQNNQIYAYEVDGYGSRNLMDDANIPSLLSAPLLGYTTTSDPVYQATRAKVLSVGDPYFMHGPVLSGVGGPHDGPGYAWPMSKIVRILTSDNETEIYGELKEIVSSTDGLGLIHESINTFNVSDWTRQWFSWANGLFGQMVLQLNQTMPELLQESYQ